MMMYFSCLNIIIQINFVDCWLKTKSAQNEWHNKHLISELFGWHHKPVAVAGSDNEKVNATLATS